MQTTRTTYEEFLTAVHAELVKNELEVALADADFDRWSDEFWSGYVSVPSEKVFA